MLYKKKATYYTIRQEISCAEIYDLFKNYSVLPHLAGKVCILIIERTFTRRGREAEAPSFTGEGHYASRLTLVLYI